MPGEQRGERLQPYLPEIVAVLERQRELVLDTETKALLLRMSGSTVDRALGTPDAVPITGHGVPPTPARY